MKKYIPFIVFLALLITIPVLTRQFLITDLVIQNEIEANKLYDNIPIDNEKMLLSKSFHYAIEMFIIFLDFLLITGIIIGLLKAYAFQYKSNEILNVISEAYSILLLGYLIKILYFMLSDDFSIEHFENYSILSLADFYNYAEVGQFKYLQLSSYNLFRLCSLLFISYSIFKVSHKNLKITIASFLIIGSIYFLIPLIGG